MNATRGIQIEWSALWAFWMSGRDRHLARWARLFERLAPLGRKIKQSGDAPGRRHDGRALCVRFGTASGGRTS